MSSPLIVYSKTKETVVVCISKKFKHLPAWKKDLNCST